ncbi:sugar transferase [Candidatus Kaiserbacteria bacterium]|nr:sugar transferase [Candidatus Kaiserbacteria bacterium]
MTLVPKREYLILLVGDVFVFTITLWLMLALRYLAWPTQTLFTQHLRPFSLLFVLWIFVFFLAGLYGKHTRLFRRKLPTLIFSTQVLNMGLAAAFFFLIPVFGIAPKTNLVLYLLLSAPLIFAWRVGVFPRLRMAKRLKGVLIASGPDARALAEEVASDRRYPFKFVYVIDTDMSPTHEVIQRACRVAEEADVTFVVVDHADSAVSAALPIIYNAAFHKNRFALVDIVDLYQEVFDRVPITLTRYAWVLDQVGASRAYDTLKRAADIAVGLLGCAVFILFYPFVMLAIKLEDGGQVFIAQQRVGRFQKPIAILKFRSMNGNDQGEYDATGKSRLTVTRTGKWLRILRIDELPQFWSVVRGDLSFVGPRPELPALAAQYSARIPYYNARYLVSPGLTGWAQIKHDRDPHHGTAIEETKEKLSYDLYYLERRSFFLDLFIMFQTIRIIFTARGT